jgi:cbb3-type cytochrome oxidase maturation protein
MNIVYLTLPMALLLGGAFVYAFIKVAISGQYDDLETPAHRMLFDDENKKEKVEPKTDLGLESQDRSRKEAKQ